MNIAIYTFHSSMDALPTFNSDYVYSYTDVDNGDNTKTRTITSDTLPTSISFNGRSGLISISKLDISGLTSFMEMFYRCGSLTEINMSDWDTSKITRVDNMFSYCTSLTSIDLSRFNTSSVTNMGYMFYGCTNLTSVNLNNWDTSKVTTVRQMFYDCTNLTSLNFDSFNNNKITDTYGMFSNCNKLASINMQNSNKSSINSIINVLPTKTANSMGTLDSGVVGPRSVNYTAANSKYWNIVSDLIVKYRFNTAKSSNYIPVFSSGFNSNKYTIEDQDEGNGIKIRTIKATTDEFPTKMQFGHANNSVSDHALLEILGINTSSLTTGKEMFAYCLGLTSLEILRDFDTSNMTDMSNMFRDAGYYSQELTLDLSNFDTSNVTDMSYMFRSTGDRCSKFNLNISNFDTSNVTNMTDMFYSMANSSTVLDFNFTIKNPGLTSYSDVLFDVATQPGTRIVVNYTEETSALVDSMVATKSSTGNVFKGVKLVDVDSIEIGDVLSIGDEQFNIISIGDDTFTMLSKYNLNSSYRQSSSINHTFNFSDTNGWDYTPGPKDVDIQIWSVKPKLYINEYVNYLQKVTYDETLSGDLITSADLYDLQCNVNQNYNYFSDVNCNNSPFAEWIVNGQNWWTKSAYPHSDVDLWKVEIDGRLNGNKHTSSNGVRPVITVSKNIFKLN